MKSQMAKAISTADKIMDMAEDSLAGLEMATSQRPAEFRAIVWDAVAAVAKKRADVARAENGDNPNTT